MIEINNLTAISVDEGFLRKVSEKTLRGEKIGKKIELSIALIRPGRMKTINSKYRGKNRATDVLAFPESQKDKISQARKVKSLGEIIICLSEVKKNARIFTPLEITGAGEKRKEIKSLTGFNSTFKEELARVLIHGILHLLGYDHEKNKQEAKIMRKKEKYYFSKILNLC